VQVYEWGVWQNQWFMVSQWAPCGDLAACLSNRKGLRSNIAWCIDVVRQLASALETCHANNIVHLDIKPANIVFEHSPSEDDAIADCVDTPLNLPTHPLLTDFGLARVLECDGNHTITGTGLGTPFYMAPEQFAGQENQIGPQTDIFSLGVVMYELLYGVRPFEGRTAVAIMDNMRSNNRSNSKYSGHVPKPLEQICERCLAFAPEDRYQSAAQLHSDLKAYASEEDVSIPRPSKMRLAQRWCEQTVRMRDAGMLALWMQGALCVSLVLLIVLKIIGLADAIPSTTTTLSRDVGLILAFPTIPSVILGFYTVANRQWAFGANVALSLAFVAMLLATLFTQSSPLTFYNNNPLAFLIGHLIILTLACIQLGAHLIALPSLRGTSRLSLR
jgi:serine/threonine protein kinase